MRQNRILFYAILLLIQATILLVQAPIGVTSSGGPETDVKIPDDFCGKWISKENTKHYVIVKQDSITWERGDIEGPEAIAVSQCQFLEGRNKISFRVKHGVGMFDSSTGKITRGSILVTMSRTGETLIIKEEQSGETVSHPSGFAFKPLGGKEHVFYKAE